MSRRRSSAQNQRSLGSLLGMLLLVILVLAVRNMGGLNTGGSGVAIAPDQPTPRATTTAASGQLRATATAAPTVAVGSGQNRPAVTQVAPSALRPPDGMELVTRDELPAEARTTLRLIAQGGPFPYRQDGSIFQNRERLLPRQPAGYYREYTVETPRSDDRGARRIIAGDDGELYYTRDHYDSFAWIVPE